MSASSRRRFLQQASTVATVACSGSWAHAGVSANTSRPPPRSQTSGGSGPADERIALEFLRHQKFLDPDLDSKPKSTVLLYGLVCADFSKQELLLPNTVGLSASGVHSHRARLWLPAEEVLGGSAPASGTITNGARTFAFWSISRRSITIEALDASGASLATLSTDLSWRNSSVHPWTDMKWVRCLKHVSSLPMLAAGDRNNTALVNSRMNMSKGSITAIPPFTDVGRNTEWKVAGIDGTEMIGATTDAMIWQREYDPTVATFRITLQPMPAATPEIPQLIAVNAVQQSLVAAVTHAMDDAMMMTHRLADTRAFAQLLVGGNVATHPTPSASRNYPPSLAASGSDGHCECGCN